MINVPWHQKLIMERDLEIKQLRARVEELEKESAYRLTIININEQDLVERTKERDELKASLGSCIDLRELADRGIVFSFYQSLDSYDFCCQYVRKYQYAEGRGQTRFEALEDAIKKHSQAQENTNENK